MRKFNTQRQTFLWLFSWLTIFIIILPFLVSFNEGLTKIVQSIFFYKIIQATIVPFEIKIAASIITFLHIPITYQADGVTIRGIYLQLTWNCVGWQSILFLFLSFLVGLQGQYTLVSLLEAVSIGLLGTFLVNIGRIVFILLLAAFFPSVFAVVFHDYLAVTLTIAWLFLYWWFVYQFVLEEK